MPLFTKLTTLLFSSILLSQTQLTAQVQLGDIAFIFWDADSGVNEGFDQFAFVALNDIAADAQIFFQDDEWEGTAFAGNEDELMWTAPTGGVTAGTVVVIGAEAISVDGVEATIPIVSTGTIEQTIGVSGIGINGGGDEIWAFTGVSDTPTESPAGSGNFTFLAAISARGFDGTPNTLNGTGLTADTAFAIELTNNIDHAFYIAPREGFPALTDYTILIESVTKNWTQESPSGVDLVADATSFVTGGSPIVTLSLSFSPETFAEDAGTIAATGTVTLSAPLSEPLAVEITSDDSTEATVFAPVNIPAGETSATFEIDAVDDLLADGDQTVTISACALGTVGAEATLTVTDDGDAPTTTLATGDILFICFNADNNSTGFVAINDIPADEVIFFTDVEWDGTEFGTGEFDIIWTAPAEGLSAGEVVILTGVNSGDITVTGGGTIVRTGTTGLSTTAEIVFAYQGPAVRQPVTFLAAITNANGANIDNTGLTAGVDALFLANTADMGQFTAFRTGQDSIADYAPLIADIAANWTVDVGGENTDILCDDTDFVTGGPVQPVVIEIVDCGISGSDFFIEIATATTGLRVTSSPALDFSTATDVVTTVDPGNPNRFLLPIAGRGLSDFFRVESE